MCKIYAVRGFSSNLLVFLGHENIASFVLTTLYASRYKYIIDRFEWKAERNNDGECELHTKNGEDFSDDLHENMICCWKKKYHKSQ
jgi:hypothetical protein